MITPAYEPIIVARKPCEGSCIDNVLEYGVGGLNIDECRIPMEQSDIDMINAKSSKNPTDNYNRNESKKYGDYALNIATPANEQGRFPANVILTYDKTTFEEVCGGMPSGGVNGSVNKTYDYKADVYGDYKKKEPFDSYGDSGSASRYFYNAQETERDNEQITYEVNIMENQEEQKIHLYSEGKSYKLYQGNMLDMLDIIEPNSIDAVVTDPPYELGFMNKGWDNSGIAFQKETWEKCLKVLKPGGYLLAFGGSRTSHRIACAIEDAGFEIRDTILWLYGSGFPKSMNISLAIDKKNGVESKLGGVKPGHEDFVNRTTDGDTRFENGMSGFDRPWMHDEEKREAYHYEKLPTSEEAKRWAGWGTQLKPAYEPITVARKPFDGACVDNVLTYGVGGINIDECRIPLESIDSKDLRIIHRSGKLDNGVFNNSNCGLTTEDDVQVLKEQGRFPANVILTYDETDFEEVCGGMPESKGASSQNNFSNGHIYRGQSLQESSTSLSGYREWYNDNGSAARYFYCAKASKRDRDEGLEDIEATSDFAKGNGLGRVCEFCGAPQLKPELCHCPVKSWVLPKRKNTHPTVKPTDLMSYLIRLVTPKGGTILDPFNGSGSTGKAAMFENKDRNANYKYIGIELTPEYLPISKARIEYAINYVDVVEEKPLSAEKKKMLNNQMSLFDIPQ